MEQVLLVGTAVSEQRDLGEVFASLGGNSYPVVVFGSTFDDAPAHIRSRPELRFIIIVNEQQLDGPEMRQTDMKLASALIDHPCKPSVIFVLGAETASRVQLFRGLQVRIERGSPRDLVRDLRTSQYADQFD